MITSCRLSLLGRLEVAAPVRISDGVVPNVRHHLEATVVRVSAIRDEVESRAAGALHISEHDAAALVLPIPDKTPNLLVVGVDVVGGGPVAEERGHDDGGTGRAGPDGVHEARDAHADVGNIDVARAVVGTGVDEHQVRPEPPHVLLGLALHLVHDEARPPLVVWVRHRRVPPVAPHVLYVVTVAVQAVPQEHPVPVALARAHSVRDRRS